MGEMSTREKFDELRRKAREAAKARGYKLEPIDESRPPVGPPVFYSRELRRLDGIRISQSYPLRKVVGMEREEPDAYCRQHGITPRHFNITLECGHVLTNETSTHQKSRRCFKCGPREGTGQ